MRTKGLEPLAARPDAQPTGLMQFAANLSVYNQFARKPLTPVRVSTLKSPHMFNSNQTKNTPCKVCFLFGADEGTRTPMVSHRNLKPARLPISPRPQILVRINPKILSW